MKMISAEDLVWCGLVSEDSPDGGREESVVR